MNNFFSVCLLMLSFLMGSAQDSTHIKFSYNQKRINEKQVALTLTAHTLGAGVKLFPIQKNKEDLVFSKVDFDSAASKFLKGNIEEKANITKENDPVLQAEVPVISDSVQWIQHINLDANDTAIVKGNIVYMYKNGEEFASAEENFKFVVLPEGSEAVAAGSGESGSQGGQKSLWWLFLLGMGGGFLALLTPCIYSMIPVTVSFFTKRSKTPQEGIRNAIYYALSIMIIFTLLGTLISLIFGPATLNNIATNWIANLFFFALFIVFGFAFLGAFELELPSWLATKTDSKASTKDFKGIFFMALTLVIVSFSCTMPIVGLLAVAVTKGNIFGAIVGFLGFSFALSLPFAFFAFFPSKLNTLGKAGGWLNAVKVTLGFLELALALKFLSNADLAMNWRILDREVFLVLWIVIFFLLGLYLIGKLKFRHDDELPKNDFGVSFLTVTRLMFAIVSFSMVVYMTPGLFGAQLKGLSAFLPPMGTQDFNADDLPKGFDLDRLSSGGTTSTEGGASISKLPEPVKYIDVMRSKEPPVVVNNGLITYFDYNEALEVARKVKKPLMLDFTGVNCINCRHMEGQVWSDPEVMKRLKNDFVIASLFIDVHSGVDLPLGEQYYSNELKKQIETLGDRNADLQVTKFGSNSQPFYFFLDEDEQRLVPDGYPYDPSVSKFVEHLDKVVVEFNKRKAS